jgi:hypothetical protein
MKLANSLFFTGLLIFIPSTVVAKEVIIDIGFNVSETTTSTSHLSGEESPEEREMRLRALGAKSCYVRVTASNKSAVCESERMRIGVAFTDAECQVKAAEFALQASVSKNLTKHIYCRKSTTQITTANIKTVRWLLKAGTVGGELDLVNLDESIESKLSTTSRFGLGTVLIAEVIRSWPQLIDTLPDEYLVKALDDLEKIRSDLIESGILRDLDIRPNLMTIDSPNN